MKIVIGDKITYDYANTKHYVLVNKIETVQFEDGSSGELINNKFSIKAPFRKPTKMELKLKDFI